MGTQTARESAKMREQAFVEWCLNEDGRKEQYVRQMAATLNGRYKSLARISELAPGLDSMFETDSKDVLDKAYEAAKKKRGPKDHNNMSAAIGKYRDFLAATQRLIEPQVTVIENGDSQQDNSYTDDMFLRDVYLDAPALQNLKSLLRRKMNLILQGAPGTGKTFAAKRLAYVFMGCEDDSRIEFVQFNKNTTYDDFVFGYRPSMEGTFIPKIGPFIELCKRARSDSEQRPYFMLIDEINRADVSAAFGELLMLIEADHRGDVAKLTSSGKPFSVPKNLYIIGMMNTADRGLALIDYALRRRFAFYDMAPAFDNPSFKNRIDECKNAKLSALVDATKALNKRIEKDLGPGFRIGHSYFCMQSPTDEDVESVLDYELCPLIDEYWFDDESTAKKEKKKLRDAIERAAAIADVNEDEAAS